MADHATSELRCHERDIEVMPNWLEAERPGKEGVQEILSSVLKLRNRLRVRVAEVLFPTSIMV